MDPFLSMVRPTRPKERVLDQATFLSMLLALRGRTPDWRSSRRGRSEPARASTFEPLACVPSTFSCACWFSFRVSLRFRFQRRVVVGIPPVHPSADPYARASRRERTRKRIHSRFSVPVPPPSARGNHPFRGIAARSRPASLGSERSTKPRRNETKVDSHVRMGYRDAFDGNETTSHPSKRRTSGTRSSRCTIRRRSSRVFFSLPLVHVDHPRRDEGSFEIPFASFGGCEEDAS